MSENPTHSSPDPETATASTLSEAYMQEVEMKRIQNSHRSVNKLPPELLSRILRIGEEDERCTRSRNFTYLGFQDLATQVCTHWRNVAIGDPSLWTYIHITRPPPHDLANLYLERAGPTALLDIDIEIRSRYWDNEPCTPYNEDQRLYHLEAMIDMLSVSGADVHRWKSLSVCVKRPDPLLKFIQFLGQTTAPALRFLSFRWKIAPHAPGEKIEKNAVTLFGHILRFEPNSRVFKRSVPNLRSIELTHVPWGFFSGPPLLPYTGLTNLSLNAAYIIHNTPKLCNLLSANPLLESLSLSTGFAGSVDVPPTERISLPALRSFSISTRGVASWVLDMLKIIDAPALHRFTICTFLGSGDGGNSALAAHIATGRYSESDTASTSPLMQIYPSLRRLDISSFHCTQSELASIFAAFPLVTHLSASSNQAELLGAPRLLLPELVCLRFPDLPCPHLGSILHQRAKAGLPIRVVVLRRDWRARLGIELLDFVRVDLYPEPAAEVNSYESEEEEYYSSDDDDENEDYNDEDVGFDVEEYWSDDSGEHWEEN